MEIYTPSDGEQITIDAQERLKAFYDKFNSDEAIGDDELKRAIADAEMGGNAFVREELTDLLDARNEPDMDGGSN